MSVTIPPPDRSTPMARLVDDCTRDIAAPWRSRNRYDSQVLGTIELALRRGYQAGFEDCEAGRAARDGHPGRTKSRTR